MQTNHFTVAVAEQRTTLGSKHWIAAGLSGLLSASSRLSSCQGTLLPFWLTKMTFHIQEEKPTASGMGCFSLQHTLTISSGSGRQHSSQATQHKAGCLSCDHGAMDRTKPRTSAVGLKPHAEWNWEGNLDARSRTAHTYGVCGNTASQEAQKV